MSVVDQPAAEFVAIVIRGRVAAILATVVERTRQGGGSLTGAMNPAAGDFVQGTYCGWCASLVSVQYESTIPCRYSIRVQAMSFPRNTVNDTFGSRRGLLNYGKYCMLQWLGRYSHYRAIRWGRVRRMVFICKGNICRSPVAAAYAAHEGMAVDSCGIDCAEDLPADRRAIEYAAGIGLDLTRHATRNIRRLHPREGDLLLGMEPAHLPALAERAGDSQISLVGLWLPRPSPYIHDPYGANPEYFRRCEDTVVAAVRGLLEAKDRGP